MMEIPEAITIASQMNEKIKGKRIQGAVANTSPHKFAWYYKDPGDYGVKLKGRTITGAQAVAGMVEISVEDATIVLSEGISPKFHATGEKLPLKHQLLVEFDDGSAMSASVQMYGGLLCMSSTEVFDNNYYIIAKESISPLSDQFDRSFFQQMLTKEGMQKLSAKAFLATEQRIPGLGNGVLQDILWNAGIHPKRKINSLSDAEKDTMFQSIKTTLMEMTQLGGRDIEKDFLGKPGGYKTRMSKNNLSQSCIRCGGAVHKESYMGGSIYYCDSCQKL